MTLESQSHVGTVLQEIYMRFYKHAKANADQWMREKAIHRQNISLVGEIKQRMEDPNFDKGLSPHLRHIQHSLWIIEEIEDERKGTKEEFSMNPL